MTGRQKTGYLVEWGIEIVVITKFDQASIHGHADPDRSFLRILTKYGSRGGCRSSIANPGKLEPAGSLALHDLTSTSEELECGPERVSLPWEAHVY